MNIKNIKNLNSDPILQRSILDSDIVSLFFIKDIGFL